MGTFRGEPVTDLVVVVPGILGSRLLKDGREVWGTTPRRLLVNLVTFGRFVKSALRIPADVDPSTVDDGVRADGLITGLTAIPGLIGMDFYDGLRDSLRRDLQLTDQQLCEFAYDWRLSCRVNGARLAAFLDEKVTRYRAGSGNTSARAVLVCHSMGGLVARWCVAKCDAASLVSKIVTIGTPHKGSMIALDAIANGVRLPREFGFDLTHLALSLPSLYELLPTYSCVGLDGAAPVKLDVPGVVDRVTALCPIDPGALTKRIESGLQFHSDLAATRTDVELICFRGAEQPTPVMATVNHTGLALSETIDGIRRGGDGVVPDDSGIPPHWMSTSAAKSAAGKHASMSNGKMLREELRVALRHAGRLMAPSSVVSARVPSVVETGASFDVEAHAVPDAQGRVPQLNLAVTVSPEVSDMTTPVTRPALRAGAGYRATLPTLPPGLYRVRIGKASPRAPEVEELDDWLVVTDKV
ncbi:esterase/lipase family protein [Kibdelosporangium phytohabitans]|uniref:Lecithin:cholesterol acyltransferase n=1 Tax=Kibdelosporangium phytohabitans TaxID=860235 RepID=A0A0N9HYE4_9PSEU|nr:hypothetical protein [Kibdelosporangium phytohabitans]ALG07288.1 hypothetical protein AOZ06_10455 [Kibdelosporangium phytohabitans]MBE1471849.1 hypothetical protein [Kibdelosporangium phytohabitans]